MWPQRTTYFYDQPSGVYGAHAGHPRPRPCARRGAATARQTLRYRSHVRAARRTLRTLPASSNRAACAWQECVVRSMRVGQRNGRTSNRKLPGDGCGVRAHAARQLPCLPVYYGVSHVVTRWCPKRHASRVTAGGKGVTCELARGPLARPRAPRRSRPRRAPRKQASKPLSGPGDAHSTCRRAVRKPRVYGPARGAVPRANGVRTRLVGTRQRAGVSSTTRPRVRGLRRLRRRGVAGPSGRTAADGIRRIRRCFPRQPSATKRGRAAPPLAGAHGFDQEASECAD